MSPIFTSGRWLIAGVLVRPLELAQIVDIDARFRRVGLFRGAHNDPLRVHLFDNARAARGNRGAGIARHNAFHAGADKRRLGLQERHSLPLHVRAHERAVGVVVFKERNERRRDRNKLLRRNVDIANIVARDERRLAGNPAVDELVH